MNITESSYFGKTILFLLLATLAFLAFKEILPERLFPEKTANTNNIVMDSLAIQAQADTTVNIIAEPTDTVGAKMVEEVDESLNPILKADGYKNLSRFYAKLNKLEKDSTTTVRVAYFGDSMNDGDFIVQDVRDAFQEDYGGQGVGFVSISSLSAGARASVSHQYSKNWYSQTFLKVKKPDRPFGIDGQVFFAKDPSQSYWVRYKAQSRPHSPLLNNPTLFYGSSKNGRGSVTVTADKEAAYSKTLTPSKLLNSLQLASFDPKSLQVNFNKADSIPIYGFNFDDGKGVHVDNFSTRGNSGLPLSILNPSLMNAFDEELNYDLIILHYGANVLGYGSLNYGWYEKSMTTVIKNLRECFPNADILVISTADKSSKIDGVMQTDPAVPALARAQRNYARKTSSGFINLYELMGGNGSMPQWVSKGQAGKDYTHFTGSGSKRIAKMIYNEIGYGYAKYKVAPKTTIDAKDGEGQ
ncbi:hypothetical protein [Dysgonomonas sp. 511]|uniref:hypothetical protein n=1 Tax=Dysgonomonas sp. 511 TaxID=2302930 RepID=UPI0021045176|nr:hypothetical protein [Dysgonomonas sp. 511]